MGSLNGRVALVSGAGRGIGRGISEALAAAGGAARAYQASVEDADADAAMVEQVRAHLGPVDLLVANAGVASRGLPVADTDPDEVQRLIATHAISAHHLARLVLPDMRKR